MSGSQSLTYCVTTKNNRATGLLAVALLVAVSACSHRPDPPAPYVPGLHIRDAQVLEGTGSGYTSLNFPVVLSPARQDRVSVKYAYVPPTTTDDYTAIADKDFVNPGSGEIVFEPGETTKQITVQVVKDSLYERDESLKMTLSSASGANIITASATGTIQNYTKSYGYDDLPPKAHITIGDALSVMALAEAPATVAGANNQYAVTISLWDKSGPITDSALDAYVMITTDTRDTAKLQSDYVLMDGQQRLDSNAIIKLPAGTVSKTLTLVVINDGDPEPQESLLMLLSRANSLGDVSIDVYNGTGSFAATIADDDTFNSARVSGSALNDTGADQGNVTYSDDSDVGADVTLPSSTDGVRGFRFEKWISKNQSTTAEPTVTDGAIIDVPWNCVHDLTTGLVWEVKTPATPSSYSVRSANKGFNWYMPNTDKNGGYAGVAALEDNCKDLDSALFQKACSTGQYVAEVNRGELCGMTGWRLPTMEELRSIMNYGTKSISYPGQAWFMLDLTFFPSATPNAANVSTQYWTSNSVVLSGQTTAASAWTIDFITGQDLSMPKTGNSPSELGRIRLVNDSLVLP